ncbi:glycosyltransferase family 2 protein [Neobacillus niacini]|uniref:glycosyltransferase family 2 protein n=1 Tax=Neobacillus niacini TaxID=86668 RepID=UPI002FFFC17A
MSEVATQIEILLATYNGEKYIEEQLNSILNQSYNNWFLLIRDDGSKDKTVEIIKKYITIHSDKMELIVDGEKNLGPSGNFSKLLSLAKANYMMFCDQDDVWNANKIEVTFQKMQELEKEFKDDLPLLVHTDLEVVDGELNTIAPSMFAFQNLNSGYSSVNQLLVQSNVTGCTVMINKKLKEMAEPIPNGIIMHDWWLALVAAAFGRIGFINKATIKYRQHGNNDTGAKGYAFKYFFNRASNIKKTYAIVKRNLRQAEIFYNTFKDVIDKETMGIVMKYSKTLELNPFKRISFLNQNNLRKQGKIRNAGFWFVIFTTINKEKV